MPNISVRLVVSTLILLLLGTPGSIGFAAITDRTAPTLRVRPVLCIADRDSERCATVFEIDWTSSTPGDYCLGSEQHSEPLRCWTQASVGEHSDRVTVTRDFYYWIATRDDPRRLSAVKVELLRLHPDDRRRERRSRHVWDVL